MLTIRLARVGRKKYATYRIVAADSRRSATGKFVTQLGSYNPHTKALVIKKEAVEAYLKNGAQPSSTMVKLLQKEKVSLPAWAEANLKVRQRAPKKEATKEAEPTKPAAAESTKETEETVDKTAADSTIEAEQTEAVAPAEEVPTPDKKAEAEAEKAEKPTNENKKEISS